MIILHWILNTEREVLNKLLHRKRTAYDDIGPNVRSQEDALSLSLYEKEARAAYANGLLDGVPDSLIFDILIHI